MTAADEETCQSTSGVMQHVVSGEIIDYDQHLRQRLFRPLELQLTDTFALLVEDAVHRVSVPLAIKSACF